MIDRVSVEEQYYVIVIETKRSSLGEAFKQCLLSMRDMRDGNGTGKVYGFVATGESWQMLRYDGMLQISLKQRFVLIYSIAELETNKS